MTLDAITGRVRIDKQHRAAYRAQLEVARAVTAAVADAGLDRISWSW